MAFIGKFLLIRPFYAATGTNLLRTCSRVKRLILKGSSRNLSTVKTCQNCKKTITRGDLCPECHSQQKLFEGEDYYLSEEGLLVFTEKYHVKRGYCCANKCRHCPYKIWDKN